jgi:hypothetical protein
MLFEIAKSLRALTRSPITTALNEAHRMAQHHLNAGGVAVAPGGADGGEDWLLPADIDLTAMDAAVAGKLVGAGGAGQGRPSALHIDNDGKVLVPADYVRRLGDGDFRRGQRWLEQVINDIRRQRVLMAARRAVAAQR